MEPSSREDWLMLQTLDSLRLRLPPMCRVDPVLQVFLSAQPSTRRSNASAWRLTTPLSFKSMPRFRSRSRRLPVPLGDAVNLVRSPLPPRGLLSSSRPRDGENIGSPLPLHAWRLRRLSERPSPVTWVAACVWCPIDAFSPSVRLYKYFIKRICMIGLGFAQSARVGHFYYQFSLC